MDFRLRPSRSVESEVRRIADGQLRHAIEALRGVGDREKDDSLHKARRHVKKIRALIRLLSPALPAYRPVNKRLRRVGRMLAPVADGVAVVDTLTRLAERYPRELPRATLTAMRKGLVRRRARVDRQAAADHVLETAASLLRAERVHTRTWRLKRHGFRAVAAGLERSARAARRAMAGAIAHPTSDSYHAWRRRTKDHWFQVRVIEGRCGDELIAWQRGLEALDGCLGEYHNCVLLEQVLMTDAMVAREQIALSIRLLRRYQHDLRREAKNLAAQVYTERPRQFVNRVRRLWRSAKDAAPHADSKPVWLRAA